MRGLSRRSRTLRAVLAIVSAVVFSAVAIAGPGATRAEALNGSDFDPRYIISNTQFYDSAGMTEGEIQSFLDGMIPGCSNSNCLDIKRTDTFSRAADRTVCGPYAGASQELTSTIIYKVQRACGINAKVLLVMLQKEQGLVTHTGPSDSRLGRAMGYACPDSAGGACDAQFYGLYNQIYKAAWQLKRYSTPDRWGTYYPGPPLAIAFHPNPGCGNVGIAIGNDATAALYNYTPYVPNAAALNNLNGTGDGCSSYGNRNFWVYYSSWFGDPTIELSGVRVSRVEGPDRFDLAVQISKRAFTGTAPVVYVTTGLAFPDALSAAPAAARAGGPLLLTLPDSLPDVVRAEIVRLNPAKIVVVGGEASVQPAVYDALAAIQPSIERLGGTDRYEASRAITRSAFPTGATSVYIATGANFPDALSASAAGAATGTPVILVPGTDTVVDDATRQLLVDLGVTAITIAGGPMSVSPELEADLATIAPTTRLSGASRFDASAAIARAAFPGTETTVYLASGQNFPDALAGAVLAGRSGTPLMVVPAYCVPQVTIDAIRAFGTTDIILLGGPNTLTPAVKYFFRC